MLGRIVPLEGVFGHVPLQVGFEWLALDDADVVQKTHHKATDARHAGYLGVEHPTPLAQRFEVALGEWILLDEQVVGQQPQLQYDACALLATAVPAEDVDKSLFVLLFVLPRLVG